MQSGLAFDLFCGAGGASTGLASLDLAVLGFELERDPYISHQRAGHPTKRVDLSTIRWPRRWRGCMDLLHGSPPCQPWSTAGSELGAGDPRDGMPWFLRAVRELEPPLVIVENVKGLTYSRNLHYLHHFVYQLENLGYCVDWRIINCADLGLPQVRERLVIVGRADLELPRWPEQSHAKRPTGALVPWVTLAEGIGWTGEGWVLETGADWKPNGVRADAQKRSIYRPAPSVTGKSQGQWWMRRPSTTIAADPRIFPPGGHMANDGRDNSRYIKRSAAKNVLRLSLEDLAVLQGFPRHYPFFGNLTSVAKQIGNASPPLLIAAVAAANLA